MKLIELLKAQCIINNDMLSIEDINVLDRIVTYTKCHNMDCLSLKDLMCISNDYGRENSELDFSPNENEELFTNDDATTDDAMELLYEISNTHQRTYTSLEHKLIETGVISGRCYISWHNNTYYPGATVDNLRLMGFEAFYNTYKNNWEKIKEFRRGLYSSMRRN